MKLILIAWYFMGTKIYGMKMKLLFVDSLEVTYVNYNVVYCNRKAKFGIYFDDSAKKID